jgi:F0F1-type ATP synthase assembly protein I
MAKQDDSKSDDSSRDDSNLGKLATLGLEIGAGAGLGALLGIWIDRKLNSAPWGVLIGTCLGIASGMYLLIKEAIKANKN